MGKRIVAMGDGLWDLFPDGPRFGGATANYACHTSILGADVHMVSGVGADERGRCLLTGLSKTWSEYHLVQSIEGLPNRGCDVKLTE
jgi:fructokinase